MGLKVFYANILYYEEKQVALSTLHAQSLLKQDNLNIRKWFCTYRLLDSIKLLLDDHNRNYVNDPAVSNINLKSMLKMEENYALMESLVIQYIDKYSSFVISISEKSIICDELILLYNSFVKSKNLLDTTFFKSENYENPRSIKLYYQFIYYYIEDYKLLKKLKKRLKMILDKISAYLKNDIELTISQLYNHNSTLLQVDASFERMGSIISANKGAELLTGYTIDQLQNNNIDLLLPVSLASKHDFYIKRYLETGYYKKLFKENKQFLRHKKGYIIPCIVVIKPMLNLKTQSFYFNCFVNEVIESFKYIITDNQGIITDLSKNIAR